MNVNISNLHIVDWAIFVFVTAFAWGMGDQLAWSILDIIKGLLGIGVG